MFSHGLQKPRYIQHKRKTETRKNTPFTYLKLKSEKNRSYVVIYQK